MSGSHPAPSSPAPEGAYAAAGVDTAAGDRAVELMARSVAATHAAPTLGRVLVGAGGFAGLVDVSALRGYARPVLATSTDGVGTKVAIAQALDRHDTIGQDLVAMVVDDLVVCGATPLFMTDYIACGRVVPERIAAIVAGIARACEATGTALVGGETAEHPGLLAPQEYDVAGAATGVVEADEILGPERVRAGDVLVAMASSGLHANGFSLVRRVVADAGWALDRHVEEFGRTLGEELLEPTRLYARAVLALAADQRDGLRAVAHVTGGGLAANLARVLPPELDGVVDRSTWSPPAVVDVIARLGGLSRRDLEATVNLGVGMVAVVSPTSVPACLSTLASAGIDAWVCGGVEAASAHHDGVERGTKGVRGGGAVLVGEHR